ncbi:MAG: ATP synthase F1 subunit delta [Planctomycetota bacterium]
MPLIDAPADALAFIYADALIAVIQDKGGQEAVEGALGAFEDILELARQDLSFGEFLASRVISTEDRENALRKVFDSQLPTGLLDFLLVLNHKDRLGHLPAIVAAFDSRVQELFGRVEVDVFTATALDGDKLGQIKTRLRETLNKDVIVHSYTEPAMIGGVKLRIGDQLVDASVASRLRAARQQLETDGVAAVKSRLGQIIDSA